MTQVSRFHGLNARKDVADMLAQMGIKAIRLGGSFCSVTKDNGEYYQWQKWRAVGGRKMPESTASRTRHSSLVHRLH